MIVFYFTFILSLLCLCDSKLEISQTDRQVYSSASCGSPSCNLIANHILSTSSGTLVGGEYAGSVTLGNFAFTALGLSDIFFMNIDNSNNVSWAISLGGSGLDYLHRFALDNNNYVLFGHLLGGNGNYGGATFSSSGYNAILIKLNSTRGHTWSKMMGSDYAADL